MIIGCHYTIHELFLYTINYYYYSKINVKNQQKKEEHNSEQSMNIQNIDNKNSKYTVTSSKPTINNSNNMTSVLKIKG